ncbi:hypothetical protein IQ249_03305 [Lusitaniella coriacea LEGE 07157]|uniref:Uncharacterized protein n=1 Tax=Lusitaniella coriacea LEGE 07157 TaxID=945747 RepID=A0A8J7ANA6_9CYAN|nr:hypothetical protein [Lusitaniella coriacea]MBE9114918.1 hypothetical protein [Lusitaniella coriacea LEGE 07157]
MQRLMRLRDHWMQILLVVCAGFLMLFTQACSGKMNAKRFEGITPESSPVTVPQSLMRQTIESEVAPKMQRKKRLRQRKQSLKRQKH